MGKNRGTVALCARRKKSGMSAQSHPTTGPSAIAIYARARTVHLERFAHLDAELIFRARNYDFDEEIAGRVPHRQLGYVRTFLRLLRTPYRVVELNEPFQLNSWPGLLLDLLALRVSDALRRRHTVVTCYAIGNDDLCVNFAAYTHFPIALSRRIVRSMMRLFVTQFDRIAFGIPVSEQIYRHLAGDRLERVSTKHFGALAPACHSHKLPFLREKQVLFLGALEERKGFDSLLRAWPLVNVEGARLVILGKGEGTRRAEEFAANRHNVQFHEDPPNEEIHVWLARSSVVVLFSQRTPRWREQVGLPILEGLSHGCTIVTSTETGIADRLLAEGHRVLPPESGAEGLAAAISAALTSPVPVERVLGSLPERDTRLIAGEWMFET
ncbi:glycosyltransferase [Rathayibacter toxicus]|nr:glycosyltransferase [Rathayibacter toxicus]QWL34109.1 glycosyltransferase [Rathayibacter toxicus]QWL36241.1 glycosyltransferase [Rathayibacter toxicus]QWL38332.1 glycosyltransferase [Rathayibacter toxicus]QWL40421.1 glycosyltransferase [Rathayibacter toxicus]